MLQGTLNALTAQVAALEARAQEQVVTIHRLETEARAAYATNLGQSKTICEQGVTIDELHATIRRLEQEAAAKDGKMADLTSALEVEREANATLRRLVTGKDSEIVDLGRNITSLTDIARAGDAVREAKDRLIALGKAALQDAKDLYSVASSKAKERQEVRVVLTCSLVLIC